MAKATAYYHGFDSYGRQMEVCLSEAGSWFHRHLGQNSFGFSWSKWTPLGVVPSHPSKIINRSEWVDADEWIDVPQDQINLRIQVGNNVLNARKTIPKFRLPN